MEGSSTRTFPRTLLDKAVELQVGKDTIRIEHPSNNLSVGGLFVRGAKLPAGAAVRVRIAGRIVFEAHGQIRSYEYRESGVGIGFTSISEQNRKALDDLIADLTSRGLPVT